MKKLFFILIIYLIKQIFSQNNENDSKSNINLDSNSENVESENIDNPLVFNILFSDLKEEWTNKMKDYVSQYIYLIPVPYKSQVDFFENITKVPCEMKGAFLLEEANSKNDIIEFKILAPNQTAIFQSSSIGAIFQLNLTETGLYTIAFSNRVLNKEVKPTLIMNSGQNLMLEKENLSETEKKMDSLLSILKKYQQNIKLSRGFRKKGNQQLSKLIDIFLFFLLLKRLFL